MLSINNFSSNFNANKYKYLISFLPIFGVKDYTIKTSNDIIQEDVLDIKNTLNKHLDANTLTGNRNYSYVLLSLFAALNIHDNRLTDLLECFTEEALEKSKDCFNPINTACMFGNCDTLNILLSDKKFHKMDIRPGIKSAIQYGYPEIISCFLNNKIDIYGLKFSVSIIIKDLTLSIPNNKNIFHITCDVGNSEILAILLKNLPCDEMLFKPISHLTKNPRDKLTPYELALSRKTVGHGQCVKLLKDTRAAIWFRLKNAAKSDDANNEIKKILDQYLQKNILTMFTTDYDYSIFEITNWRNNPDLCDILTNHLTGLSIADQTRILLNLDTQNNILASQTHDNMLSALIKNKPLIEDLNLNVVVAKNPNILKCHEELISSNAVKRLFVKGPGEIPEWLYILKSLTLNTSIIEAVYTSRDSYNCNLLNLIIQRNSAMSRFKNQIFKDSIFNKYVPAINECITELNDKYDESLSIEPLEEIVQKKPYKLFELCLFSLSTKPGYIDQYLHDDYQLN